MIKRIQTLLKVLLVGSAAITGLDAQATGDGKTVKCRFRLYGWDEPITDLHYNLKGKDVKLVIYQDTRSIFYDYSGPQILTLYRLRKNEEGDLIREPAARANLEVGGTWPLIVISEHRPKPGTYQTIVLKDDLASFPTGSYAFSNFSNTQVGGILGTEKFVLNPGEHKLLSGRPKEGGKTLAALFFSVVDNRKEPIYTNNWAIRPAIRTRVFVRASPESSTGVVARRLVESTVFPRETTEELTQTN